MKDLPGNPEESQNLTHIAVEGSIDLSKIGSGECNITAWRYICTDTMVKLNWGLEDYPLDTDVITDMKIDFYDWNTLGNMITTNSEVAWSISFNQVSYNTVNTAITFSDNTLKKRHIYIAKLSRKKNNITEIIGWRVLITTPIYNELFVKYNDYCSEEAKSEILSKNNVKIVTCGHIHQSYKNYFNTFVELTVPNITESNQWTVLTINENDGSVSELLISG